MSNRIDENSSKKYTWYMVIDHARHGRNLGISRHNVEKYIEGELGKRYLQAWRSGSERVYV